MFEGLAEKLQEAFKNLRGDRKLTEADVEVALREVRIALLEADVNFRVVKEFIARVKEQAIGGTVLDGLNPAHQVVKIVHGEMVKLLAGEGATDDNTPIITATGLQDKNGPAALNLAPKGLSVIMLCGLQGAGKTTLSAKLAAYLRKQGKQVVLAACDVQRPAAIKQLQVVGEQAKTPVFTIPGSTDPVKIAIDAKAWAEEKNANVLILDTAGRLHVDETLMDELKAIKAATEPGETLLVLDAMTGQDAVNVAKEFDGVLDVSGFVMTKMDGDTRGGAAISIRAVVGKPIKFIGVGEKMEALEPFYPDRAASRILGMGDVMSLIEKAESAIDEKQAAQMEKKLRQGKFDFEDFLAQMQQMRKLGPLQELFKLIPGVGSAMKDVDFSAGEKEMARFEAIVRSMTAGERRRPEIINGSRRKRIAAGAAVPVAEVNTALKRFDEMRQMMQGLASGNMPGMPGGMPPIPGMKPQQRGIPGAQPMPGAGNIVKRKSAGSGNNPGGDKGGGPRFGGFPFGRGGKNP
ncbi:MAG: signal recognition particle protein [Akkermansiaceae bacterium]|nr:signal recognition particle protein [Armatimonadota bacterium]